jgi:hypothetical protein
MRTPPGLYECYSIHRIASDEQVGGGGTREVATPSFYFFYYFIFVIIIIFFVKDISFFKRRVLDL